MNPNRREVGAKVGGELMAVQMPRQSSLQVDGEQGTGRRARGEWEEAQHGVGRRARGEWGGGPAPKHMEIFHLVGRVSCNQRSLCELMC